MIKQDRWLLCDLSESLRIRAWQGELVLGPSCPLRWARGGVKPAARWALRFMAAVSTVAMYDKLDTRWMGRCGEDRGVYEFNFFEENDHRRRRVRARAAPPRLLLAGQSSTEERDGRHRPPTVGR